MTVRHGSHKAALGVSTAEGDHYRGAPWRGPRCYMGSHKPATHVSTAEGDHYRGAPWRAPKCNKDYANQPWEVRRERGTTTA
eukprot:5793476-Karenia_brevis.AAC.1